MNSRDDFRRGSRSPKDRQLRKPSTCPLCRAPVIWARIARERRRFGGRHHVPIPLERCNPGTGDIALALGLFGSSGAFVGQEAPLAERVAIGTSYRSHRDHCPALAKSSDTSNRTAAAPKAFSAANFTSSKKPARGGSR